ncbi:MAG: hypothetical protein IIW53_05105 [Rikenellaceae bacterium]|nr:hypothetical protein [Rikenellaceae bacterium]MBQ5853456.1 hypothetical protein [Rikenellaceae bacterium]
MKTIINVGLGLALAFCLVFFVSGKFEEYVDAKVEAAVSERLGAVEEDVVAEDVTEEVEPTSQPAKVTANNREYIEVRSSKGKAKIYIGQPKAEVLDLLGTPDSFDFGGTSENCRYRVNGDYYWIHFRNGKLTEVDKY